MNAFILDVDLKTNVQMHCDAHVVKIILESAQMASTAYREISGMDAPYRSTHKNHPVTQWARQTYPNFIWMCNYGLELCKEYTFRYGKIHKTQSVLEWLKSNSNNLSVLGGDLTPPYQAMPDEYKQERTWLGAVQAYRDYYNKVKRFEMKTGCLWEHNRGKPSWYY